jgi:hypothetical protein
LVGRIGELMLHPPNSELSAYQAPAGVPVPSPAQRLCFKTLVSRSWIAHRLFTRRSIAERHQPGSPAQQVNIFEQKSQGFPVN